MYYSPLVNLVLFRLKLMIIKSFDHEPKKQKRYFEQIQKEKLFAVPIDRLGAICVDLFISYTISGLLASPLQRSFSEAQVLGSMGEMLLYSSLILSLHLSFFVFFQSLSMGLFQQSIGQRVFKIKVLNVFDGKALSLGQCFKRNFFFCLEIPFLIPLTAIFSDSYRRILHEKLSDSISVTDSNRYTNAPTTQEKSFMKGLLIPAYLWVFAAIVSLVSSGANLLLEDDEWLAELNASIPHCEKVVSAVKDWPKTENKVNHSRLMIALSLYSSKQISKECLLSEADAAFLIKKNLDYAYLAKAFALEGVVELSDDYLSKVCESGEETEACLFTKLINYWANSDWDRANNIVRSLVPGGSSFIRNYAIEHFMGRKDYAKAYSLIELQSDNPHLKNYLAKYRSKALWNLGKEEIAEVSFMATKTLLDTDLANKEQAWLCWKSLKQSCSAKDTRVCQSFSSPPSLLGAKVSDDEILAGLNHFECSRNKNSTELKYLEQVAGEAAKAFIQAYQLKDRKFMYQLISRPPSNKLSPELHHEIVDRLAKSTDSIAELDALKSIVLNSNKYASDWENSVLSIQQAYYSLRAIKKAELLAKESLDGFETKGLLKKNLMLNAYNKSSKAWIRQLNRGFKSDRSPASVEGFSKRKSSIWKFENLLKDLEK